MQPLLLLMAFLLPPGLGQEITGGHEAKPHSRPYMAFIQFLGEKSWKRCGGVLTQKDFVLTAAHCRGSSMSVTLGAHNIKQRAIRHPEYNPKNFSNDIMLLQLERKAKQTSAVKPLSLPRAMAWVALGAPATSLQEAEVTVQEDWVRATQICVGDPRKVKTGFKGDSGGPLVCKKVVHGTFSYGTMNGIPPGVFTQVSHFLPWIKRTMKHL
ncbi:hypothetical protein FD755_024905 [Muntiacus reevesi]|uniref:Peptidase S1 domain-containing protein n=1 Tax=Muntiacus reevesi TaxID=9886 RepID=A0A5N3US44_MUNRE|nr:hypothetical protein FD755_024905 [Muntiacus reevesi]